MVGKQKKAIGKTAKEESVRAYVRVDSEDQKALEELAGSMGTTAATVRTMAFKAGLEILKSRAPGDRGEGSKYAMESSRMGESEIIDLEARIDELEAQISEISEAVLGLLAMLSLILDRRMETTHSVGQEEG